MTAARALIVLAAGGTGGHLFPAEALAAVLIGRGYRVALITDRRGTGFGERMASVELHRISAGGVAGGSLVRRAQSVVQLGVGFFQARSLLAQLKPGVAVGFGGYASVPTILAASFAGVPTVLHEQNAILGRANRLLARAPRASPRPSPAPSPRPTVSSSPAIRCVRPSPRWRSRPTRRRKRTASSTCWSPAAARAPAPSAACCRKPSRCCRKASAAGSPWCSNAAPRIWSA